MIKLEGVILTERTGVGEFRSNGAYSEVIAAIKSEAVMTRESAPKTECPNYRTIEQLGVCYVRQDFNLQPTRW